MMKIVRCICALLLLLLAACEKNENGHDVILIAHAGGTVDGAVMTNSREALFAARDKGYKYIEFEIGAYAVVIGSAITRPHLITRRFVEVL